MKGNNQHSNARYDPYSSGKDESWSIMKGFEKNEGKQVKLQQLMALEEAHYNRHDSQTSAFSEI